MSKSKPSVYQVMVQPKHQLRRIISFQRWLLMGQIPGRMALSIFLSWITHALYGFEISTSAGIPPSVKFPHPMGIVMGAGVVLGERVVIYQNVTLSSRGKASIPSAYPQIGNDVVIYAGAFVVVGTKEGTGSIIGANAVVSGDIPDHSIVLAPKPNVLFRAGKPAS